MSFFAEHAALLLILGVVVAVGAWCQASVGFGVGMVAAPFVIWLQPQWYPGILLVLGFALPVVQLLTQPRDIHWRYLGTILGARLLTTPVGAFIVLMASADAITLAVALLILVAVAVSIRAPHFRATSSTVFGAGLITGVTATVGAIGGPFVALTLRNEKPDVIRSTLAASFLVGSLMAISGVAWAGHFTADHLRVGLALIPAVVLGAWASGPTRHWLDAGRLRTAIAWYCVLSCPLMIAKVLAS